MGITCMHLWRREYPTRRHYHPYQVSNWFQASVWLFSRSTTIQCKLWTDLARFECTEMTLDATRPSMFPEEKWEYLLTQLESSDLLGVPLNVFWRESSLSPHIIGVLTKNRVVYFFSNYYVRLVYKVVSDELPPELSDLFIDDGACLKGVYIKPYERNSPKWIILYIFSSNGNNYTFKKLDNMFISMLEIDGRHVLVRETVDGIPQYSWMASISCFVKSIMPLCLNIQPHPHNHLIISGNSNYLLVYIWSTHRLHVTIQMIPYSMNVIQLNRLLVRGTRWVFQLMICHCLMYHSLILSIMLYPFQIPNWSMEWDGQVRVTRFLQPRIFLFLYVWEA